MKKSLLSLAFSSLMFAATAQPVTWNVDASHSNVKFSVTHMVVSDVEGYFKKFDGKVVAAKNDFTDAKINFTVDVATVNTDNDDRDKHLKSDDFFNTEKYPNMSFTSTSFKKTGEKSYVLEGNLTIRDVTKPVKFDVTYGGQAQDPWGNTKAGFKARTVVDRKVYGLKWSKASEAGGLVLGDDVVVMLNIELTKAK